MKCLPNCQNIDLLRPRVTARFGNEWRRPVCRCSRTPAANTPCRSSIRRFADPKLLRFPLECGVTVIAAHCGDQQRCRSITIILTTGSRCSPKFPNLYGDISALVSLNRCGHLRDCLEPEIAPRILHGSDFPVPVLGHRLWLQGWIDWRTFRAVSADPRIRSSATGSSRRALGFSGGNANARPVCCDSIRRATRSLRLEIPDEPTAALTMIFRQRSPDFAGRNSRWPRDRRRAAEKSPRSDRGQYPSRTRFDLARKLSRAGIYRSACARRARPRHDGSDAREAFRAICDYHASGGTTSLLLTTATAPIARNRPRPRSGRAAADDPADRGRPCRRSVHFAKREPARRMRSSFAIPDDDSFDRAARICRRHQAHDARAGIARRARGDRSIARNRHRRQRRPQRCLG